MNYFVNLNFRNSRFVDGSKLYPFNFPDLYIILVTNMPENVAEGMGLNLAGSPEQVLKHTRNVEVRSFSVGDKEYVGKPSESIRNDGQREGEGRDEHYQRRLKRSLEWIREKQRSQAPVTENVTIKAPAEHYVIQQDENGLPYPIAYQERVAGKYISETETLEPKTREQIKLLLQENRKVFFKTGRCLDLVGSHDVGENVSFKEKFLHPLENSTNILVTSEGDIALIDPHVGYNLSRQWIKFIALEKEYWKMVIEDAKNNFGRAPAGESATQ